MATDRSMFLYLFLPDEYDIKPCIVHRDVSSKNVLVSSGLTCVLSDFGFAMKMPEIGSTRSAEDIITEVNIYQALIVRNILVVVWNLTVHMLELCTDLCF